MKSLYAVILTLVIFSTAAFSADAVAQALPPVVDISAGVEPAEQEVVVNPAAAAESERYYQMQVLQEEVRMLRGMVEELNYQLQQIKQRQMDDYLDLDRRVSAIATSSANSDSIADVPMQGSEAPTTAVADTGVQQDLDSNLLPAVQSEKPLDPATRVLMKENYDQASSLLLKQRDFDGATLAFKQHIVDYPSSPFAANAYYWLGEIYLLQGQDELARQSFTAVVEQHVGHSKAMDASFKLGKIYHQLGDVERAKQLLEAAAASGGGVANKARTYLNNNF
ncbi:MAG: tetratricopeptide repeat protein [Porticoccaceae bacterium]|jgi:tol-pal system protein YbgF|nr:tetratricopeptide repeat protein [Porticoccaceae bacterium]MBT5577612.1 tetratricopeptide repeat protein [Porticoccaceae bacterium]MBT7374903.1 tetratricopeptide repeat protein [Porticoccaceae bacterium]